MQTEPGSSDLTRLLAPMQGCRLPLSTPEHLLAGSLRAPLREALHNSLHVSQVRHPGPLCFAWEPRGQNMTFLREEVGK